MAVHDRILAAIEAVYDAAIDETRWTDALTMLAHATGSQAASFWVLSTRVSASWTGVTADIGKSISGVRVGGIARPPNCK